MQRDTRAVRARLKTTDDALAFLVIGKNRQLLQRSAAHRVRVI